MTHMPKDTATRYQGIYARHKQDCTIEDGRACSCKPSYWGKVYDRATRSSRKTAFVGSLAAARVLRADLQTSTRAGTIAPSTSMRFASAADAYLRAASSGRALNKHGRPYKPSAVRDLRGALKGRLDEEFGPRRLADLRRSDVQALVNDLAPKLSGSRIRTLVNAIHSLYAWAQDLELAMHDPASRVRLPAMNATPRDRVAMPQEMAVLLAALPLEDALPYALAAYGGLRRSEIRRARVADVDLEEGTISVQLSKSAAGVRIVPIVRPLSVIVLRSLMARGRPGGDELLCPARKPGGGNSGLLSFEALQTRADAAWEKVGKRITPHECRHTCITWLDAAGVRPVVVSRIAGHAVSSGGAAVTARYTHVVPGDIEEAGRMLDVYLAGAQMEATG